MTDHLDLLTSMISRSKIGPQLVYHDLSLFDVYIPHASQKCIAAFISSLQRSLHFQSRPCYARHDTRRPPPARNQLASHQAFQRWLHLLQILSPPALVTYVSKCCDSPSHVSSMPYHVCLYATLLISSSFMWNVILQRLKGEEPVAHRLLTSRRTRV